MGSTQATFGGQVNQVDKRLAKESRDIRHEMTKLDAECALIQWDCQLDDHEFASLRMRR